MMSRMTGELHDAHTRFNSPEQWKKYKKQQGVSSGISVDDVDGQTVVTTVRRDSSAAHAGIEPGMVVLSIDGKPVAERIAEIERNKAAFVFRTRYAAFSAMAGCSQARRTPRCALKWNARTARASRLLSSARFFLRRLMSSPTFCPRDTPTSGSMASSRSLLRNFDRLSNGSKMRRGS